MTASRIPSRPEWSRWGCWTRRLVRCGLLPRRLRVYGVGAPKTGTHSVASLFDPVYRAAHEPEKEALVDRLNNGRFAESAEVDAFLRERDARLRMEVEASHVIAWYADALARLFPDALFILTVRDCVSWLNSIVNQQLNLPLDPDGRNQALRRTYFHREAESDAEPDKERALADAGLFPLDGYLAYWARHNDFILRAVPRDRLLVLPLRRLSGAAARLAAFCGVRESSLTPDAHAYKASKDHRLVDRIDRAYLRERIRRHCSDTIATLAREYDLEESGLHGLDGSP